jgi:N-ethylmaleimide reductase
MRKLLSGFYKNGFELKNHIVMAPMTRARAIDNLPNELMAEYYEQRSGAGLIITEGVATAPEALGYPNIPGIFSKPQVERWKSITEKVHKGNSKIFLQLMHTGRIGHADNLPDGFELSGASAIAAAGQIFTITGKKDHSHPVPLSTAGIKNVIKDFATAAKNAIEAGFDGVEIHGANGYLVEQFLNPNVNTRTDEYGGSIENRARFIVELSNAVAEAIGHDKVGIRLSPFSTLGDLAAYDEEETHLTYSYLAERLNALNIAYLHVGVNGPIPEKTFDSIRKNFDGIIILCNGLTTESAEKALHGNFADLVAFGRAFLANPDLVNRIEKNATLNEVDFTTLYGSGAAGYTDYSTLQ